MKAAAVRLALVSVLFLGWVGYLAFLAFTTPRTPSGKVLVLSRPQFLVSDLDVIGVVNAKTGEVTVEEVLYPKKGAPVEVGETIRVKKLDHLASEYLKGERHLIPLRTLDRERQYEVVQIPSSPGYSRLDDGTSYRIYPATAEALAQYRQIRQP